MKVLRIIFTILSALCLAAILPAGTFGGLPHALICAVGAGVFFLFVLLFKKLHEKKSPNEPEPDFLNTENKPDDENKEEK